MFEPGPWTSLDFPNVSNIFTLVVYYLEHFRINTVEHCQETPSPLLKAIITQEISVIYFIKAEEGLIHDTRVVS